MKSRLLNFLTAASLLVAVLASVFWVRSHWTDDNFLFGPEDGRIWEFGTDNPGMLYLQTATPWQHHSVRQYLAHDDGVPRKKKYLVFSYRITVTKSGADRPIEVEWGRLLFRRVVSNPVIAQITELADGYESAEELNEGPGTARFYVLHIPCWMVVVAGTPGVLFIVVRLIRLRIHRRRQSRRLCTACGYDLRASHAICPECGAPIIGEFLNSAGLRVREPS